MKPSSFVRGPNTIASQMLRIYKYLRRGYTWQGRQFEFSNPTHTAHRRGPIPRWRPRIETTNIEQRDFFSDSFNMATFGSQHTSRRTDSSNESTTDAATITRITNKCTTDTESQESYHLLRWERAASLLRAGPSFRRAICRLWPANSANTAIRTSLKQKRLRRVLLNKRATQRRH